jgi:hypothetical protein
MFDYADDRLTIDSHHLARHRLGQALHEILRKDKVVIDALIDHAKPFGCKCIFGFRIIHGGAVWKKEIYDTCTKASRIG